MRGSSLSKPILCLDFDGVIHSYTSGWVAPDVIPDPPTPGALDFLLAAERHFRIVIHSSRFVTEDGLCAVLEWLEHHFRPLIGYFVDSEEDWKPGEILLTARKPQAFVTLDDRAITFTGTWPDPQELLKFRPWNKRAV
jgi:hypothetical protein